MAAESAADYSAGFAARRYGREPFAAATQLSASQAKRDGLTGARAVRAVVTVHEIATSAARRLRE